MVAGLELRFSQEACEVKVLVMKSHLYWSVFSEIVIHLEIFYPNTSVSTQLPRAFCFRELLWLKWEVSWNNRCWSNLFVSFVLFMLSNYESKWPTSMAHDMHDTHYLNPRGGCCICLLGGWFTITKCKGYIFRLVRTFSDQHLDYTMVV